MDKREFIKLASLAGVAALSNPSGLFANAHNSRAANIDGTSKAPFELPALPYATNALEPNIDKITMEIHHDKHHAAYVKNLNDALNGTTMASLSLEQILAKVTEKDKAIRNNAGGHYNHSLFWTLLSPEKTTPSDKLQAAIKSQFGSWETFQQKFNDAAKGVFGSGWAWLIVTPNKKLSVISTPNQDNPLMHQIVKEKGTPILALDVWEHAYYLKYQNRRPDYITAFWNVINWKEVDNLYTAALK
ncbi:superoxide dismutase [Chitinophaga pendula]|uniref:superoxide dismutase n=1 Tax=Chitinophaga TaxID=79328 RepID=UPI000BB01F74|nr:MULTISPECIES: superoxide dismutase [Chitinophaga]ASZ10927.1 superoxide dismutase [Chitinophaga sp. MD30]UCJ06085.1 superoxide dismutase [Chitinophaga pendula]